MKAVVHTQYGPPEVLHLREVEKPTPGDHDVLIRVRASTVNFGDVLARNFRAVTPRGFSMPTPLWLPTRLVIGLRKPRRTILGAEFAGEIETVGSAVTTFQPGDAVFGYPGMNFGAQAEYLRMRDSSMIAPKPANLSFEQAAALPYGAITALNIVSNLRLQPGQRVMIIGASGAIGSYAVQVARHFGAEVTGVCSTSGLEMVRSLGADRVIDYTREDYAAERDAYDVILDVPGKSSFRRCKAALKPDGRYVRVSFKTRHLIQMLRTSITGGRRVICAFSSEKPAVLRAVRDLAEAGTIRPAVDRCFPLEQTAEAHRYVEQGHKQGTVVITVA